MFHHYVVYLKLIEYWIPTVIENLKKENRKKKIGSNVTNN